MPHPFLSDEWFTEAHRIRERYQGQVVPSLPKLRIQWVARQVPFGDGEVRLWTDTTSGEMVMEKGQIDAPDVTLTAPYEVARQILVDQDPQAAAMAFMQGKVRIDGDMMKLMAGMQGITPGAELESVARTIAEEIKAITE